MSPGFPRVGVGGVDLPQVAVRVRSVVVHPVGVILAGDTVQTRDRAVGISGVGPQRRQAQVRQGGELVENGGPVVVGGGILLRQLQLPEFRADHVSARPLRHLQRPFRRREGLVVAVEVGVQDAEVVVRNRLKNPVVGALREFDGRAVLPQGIVVAPQARVYGGQCHAEIAIGAELGDGVHQEVPSLLQSVGLEVQPRQVADNGEIVAVGPVQRLEQGDGGGILVQARERATQYIAGGIVRSTGGQGIAVGVARHLVEALVEVQISQQQREAMVRRVSGGAVAQHADRHLVVLRIHCIARRAPQLRRVAGPVPAPFILGRRAVGRGVRKLGLRRLHRHDERDHRKKDRHSGWTAGRTTTRPAMRILPPRPPRHRGRHRAHPPDQRESTDGRQTSCQHPATTTAVGRGVVGCVVPRGGLAGASRPPERRRQYPVPLAIHRRQVPGAELPCKPRPERLNGFRPPEATDAAGQDQRGAARIGRAQPPPAPSSSEPPPHGRRDHEDHHDCERPSPSQLRGARGRGSVVAPVLRGEISLRENLLDQRRQPLLIDTVVRVDRLSRRDRGRGRVKLHPAAPGKPHLNPGVGHVPADGIEPEHSRGGIHEEADRNAGGNTQRPQHQGHGKREVRAVPLAAFEQEMLQLIAGHGLAG